MINISNNIYDILIIGSGGAGCSAAIEASKTTKNILMVTKGDFLHSKTARAQGGIQASIGENDSPSLHYEDTLKAGENVNNRAMVKVLTEHASDTITWLEEFGVYFDKTDDKYDLSSAAGLTFPRILTCGGEAGERILKPLAVHVQKLGISILEHIGVTDIIKEGDYFKVFLSNKDDSITTARSKTVIIASGGFIQKELEIGLTKSSEVSKALNTLRIAKNLNLEIMNTDLMQYHPTGVVSPNTLRRERLPETMRGDGATLVNKFQEPFVDSLITRGKLTEAIIEECRQERCVSTGNGYRGVWMKTQNIDQIHGKGYLAQKYPKLYKTFLEKGVDISQDPVLVYPVLHYSLGGIKSNAKTETNLLGCYVAGEASWGVHGSDRLMGNALLEIFVFGRIAGQEAAKYAL